ncbi:MAG: CbtB-domain containing protein [Proteobacteria bacterium]|nr:CbtB-domain containing protein [Pseudomonadota bacterium]
MPTDTKYLDEKTLNDHVLVTTASRVGPALLALLFGSFLLLGAGFAGSATLHNAAHDGRHALSFPCH